MENTIICPGCGWTGTTDDLGEWGQCPNCGYENSLEPFRLLTVSELLEDKSDESEFHNVNLPAFLRAFVMVQKNEQGSPEH